MILITIYISEQSHPMNSQTATTQAPNPSQIDEIQAAIFYLMTQFSFSHCPSVAEQIVADVTHLLEHPNIELLPRQYAVLASLLNQWRLHSVASTEQVG